jgi:hypothetical protein
MDFSGFSILRSILLTQEIDNFIEIPVMQTKTY